MLTEKILRGCGMDISTAQSELRNAYVHGGPGTVISGFVWLAAGITETYIGVPTAFLVLFFGGMLIFPATYLILLAFFRRQSESDRNPGRMLVIESVFPMIGGLFAAWLILPHRPDFVFPIAAISVGAHYFSFRTAYGDWMFWVLGSIMCSIGIASIFLGMPAKGWVAFSIAGVELIFGCWFLLVDFFKKSSKTNSDEAIDMAG
jgi:hypothetical protein